jgi:hypothetical protein
MHNTFPRELSRANPPPLRSTPFAWLLGNFASLKLPRCALSSSMLLPSPCVTLLGEFTSLKLSSCATSKSKPSRLLSSSSQAVCSRAPDLPIATFDSVGKFTTLKLPRCALSNSMLLPSPSEFFTLRVLHPPAPSCGILPPSSLQAVHPCARPSSLLPSTSSAILQPWKFSSCMPSSSKL